MAELATILERTTTDHAVEPRTVLSRQELLELQALVRKVPVAKHVQDFAVRLLLATRPQHPDAPASVRRSNSRPQAIISSSSTSRSGACISPRRVGALSMGEKPTEWNPSAMK